MTLSKGNKEKGGFDDLVDAIAHGDEVLEDSRDDDHDETSLVEELPNNWDPFDGIVAPNGYCYYGKLTLVCYGPTSRYFSAILSMNGDLDKSIKKKREGLRTAQRKDNVARANVDCDVGGSTRNVSADEG